MNSEFDLDKRVSVLEKSMEWAQGSIQKIDRDLDILKSGQMQILERLMDYKSDTDQRIFETNERISSLQAETVERISELKAHTDERISALQAHTDEKFISVHAQFAEVHAEFANVHREISGIHSAITQQTKWLLTVMLAAATVASVLHPVMLKLIAGG